MELSIKQSEMFANWYIEKYGKKDENGVLITPVEIPVLPASIQRDEVKEWCDIILKIVGPSNAKQVYKYRGNKKELVFEKVFNSLYLQYGPTFKEEDGSPAKEHLWYNDVINVKDFLKISSGKKRKES